MSKKELQKIAHSLSLEISKIEEQLQRLPRGKLICSHSGPYPRYLYSLDGGKYKHIKTKNRQFACELALRHFLECKRDELTDERTKLERLSTSLKSKSELMLDSSSPFYPLLSNLTSHSEELSKWQTASYDKNPFYPEGLSYKTYSGEFVRSKSEVIIANYLFLNQIPYRYECALQINGYNYYPDFTILHPTTKKLFLWEHFGLMDDPDYANRAFQKLQKYASVGYIPANNLIITFEAESTPLDTSYIENLISYHFS